MKPQAEETEAVENKNEEKLTLKKLDASDIKKAELQAMADKYANLVVTEETVEEANKARLSLRRERLDIQKDEKFNNDVLNKAKKINASKAEELIGLIEPREKELEAKIDKVKAAIEKREKEEKEKEEKRIAAHKAAITMIENLLPKVRTCTDEEELDTIALDVSVKENTFEEFNEQGNEMIKTVLSSIENRKLFLQEEAKAEALKKSQEPAVPAFDAHEENVVSKEEFKATSNIPTGSIPPPDNRIPPEMYSGTKTEYPAEQKKESPLNMKVFDYGGYRFGISSALDNDVQGRIEACIKEIVDDLPM